MSDKNKKLEKQGPYIVIPKTGSYKKRRPWKKWSGGSYKEPKLSEYTMGDKKYEFKEGGRAGYKSGGCAQIKGFGKARRPKK